MTQERIRRELSESDEAALRRVCDPISDARFKKIARYVNRLVKVRYESGYQSGYRASERFKEATY